MTRRTTIVLPELTVQQAHLLFEILTEAASAVWDEHDPEIGWLAAQKALDEAARREHEEEHAAIADDDLLF